MSAGGGGGGDAAVPTYNGRPHKALTLCECPSVLFLPLHSLAATTLTRVRNIRRSNYRDQPFHVKDDDVPDFEKAILYRAWLQNAFPTNGPVAIVAEGIATDDGGEIRHYMVDFWDNLQKFRTQVCLNPNPRSHPGGVATWYTLTMEDPYRGWYLDIDAKNQNDRSQIICACVLAYTVASTLLATLFPDTPKSQIVAATDSSRPDGGKISFHLHFEYEGAYACTLGDMIRYAYATFDMIGRAAAADAPDADDGFAGVVFAAFTEAGVTPEMARLVLSVSDPVPYKYKANIRGIGDAKAVNMITAAVVDSTSPLFAPLTGNPDVDLTRLLKHENPLTPEGVVAALRISLLTYDARDGNCRRFEFHVVTCAGAVSKHATFTSAFTTRPETYEQNTDSTYVYLGFPPTSQESTCLKRFDAARIAGEQWALDTLHFAWHPTLLAGYKTGIMTTAPPPIAKLMKVKFRAGNVVGKGAPPQAVIDELIPTVYEFVLGLGEHMAKLAEFVVGRLTWGGFADKHTGLPVVCAEMDTTLCPRRLLNQTCLAKGVCLTHTSRKATIYVRVESGRVRVNLHDLSGSGHNDAEGNTLRPVEFVMEHAPHTIKYLTPIEEEEEESLDDAMVVDEGEGDADVDIELPDGLCVSSDEEEEEVIGRRRRRRVIASDSEEEEEEEEVAIRRRCRRRGAVVLSDNEVEEEDEDTDPVLPAGLDLSSDEEGEEEEEEEPPAEKEIVEEVPSDAEDDGATPSPAGGEEKKKKKRKLTDEEEYERTIDRRRAVHIRAAPYDAGMAVVDASDDEILSEHDDDENDSCIDDEEEISDFEFQPDMEGDCWVFDVVDVTSDREYGSEATPYVWLVIFIEALLRKRGPEGLAMLEEETKNAAFHLANALVITATSQTTHPTTSSRTVEDIVENLNGACEEATRKMRSTVVYVRSDGGDGEVRRMSKPKWLSRETNDFIDSAARHAMGWVYVDWEDPSEDDEEKPTCGTAEEVRALLGEIDARDEEIPLSEVCTSILALIPPPESYVGPDADVVTRAEFREFREKQRAQRRAEAQRIALRATGQMMVDEAFFNKDKSALRGAVVQKRKPAVNAWDSAVAVAATPSPVVIEHVGEPQAKRKKKEEIDPAEERKKKGLQSIAGFFQSFGAKK